MGGWLRVDGSMVKGDWYAPLDEQPTGPLGFHWYWHPVDVEADPMATLVFDVLIGEDPAGVPELSFSGISPP